MLRWKGGGCRGSRREHFLWFRSPIGSLCAFIASFIFYLMVNGAAEGRDGFVAAVGPAVPLLRLSPLITFAESVILMSCATALPNVSAPDTYAARSCSWSVGVTFSILAAPPTPLTPGTYHLHIEECTVPSGANGYLQIILPSTAALAAANGPMGLSIRRNTFLLNAILKISGHIPQGSVIEALGNTFNIQNPNSWGPSNSLMGAIFFACASGIGPTATQVVVSHNVVTFDAGASVVHSGSISAILFCSPLATFAISGAGSSLSIRNNTLTQLSPSTSIYVVVSVSLFLLYLQQSSAVTFFQIGSDGQFLVEGNTIQGVVRAVATTITLVDLRIGDTTVAGSNLLLNAGGQFMITSNTLRDLTVHSHVSLFKSREASLNGGTMILSPLPLVDALLPTCMNISFNTIANVVEFIPSPFSGAIRRVFVEMQGTFQLSGGALLSVTDNIFRDVAFDSGVASEFRGISIGEGSAEFLFQDSAVLLIASNHFLSITNGAFIHCVSLQGLFKQNAVVVSNPPRIMVTANFASSVETVSGDLIAFGLGRLATSSQFDIYSLGLAFSNNTADGITTRVSGRVCLIAVLAVTITLRQAVLSVEGNVLRNAQHAKSLSSADASGCVYLCAISSISVSATTITDRSQLVIVGNIMAGVQSTAGTGATRVGAISLGEFANANIFLSDSSELTVASNRVDGVDGGGGNGFDFIIVATASARFDMETNSTVTISDNTAVNVLGGALGGTFVKWERGLRIGAHCELRMVRNAAVLVTRSVLDVYAFFTVISVMFTSASPSAVIIRHNKGVMRNAHSATPMLLSVQSIMTSNVELITESQVIVSHNEFDLWTDYFQASPTVGELGGCPLLDITLLTGDIRRFEVSGNVIQSNITVHPNIRAYIPMSRDVFVYANNIIRQVYSEGMAFSAGSTFRTLIYFQTVHLNVSNQIRIESNYLFTSQQVDRPSQGWVAVVDVISAGEDSNISLCNNRLNYNARQMSLNPVSAAAQSLRNVVALCDVSVTATPTISGSATPWRLGTASISLSPRSVSLSASVMPSSGNTLSPSPSGSASPTAAVSRGAPSQISGAHSLTATTTVVAALVTLTDTLPSTPSPPLTLTVPLKFLVPIPRNPLDAVPGATDLAHTGSGWPLAIGSLGGGLVGGQMGVANAMTRMSSCGGDDSADGGGDGLPILVHPLRFSFRLGGGDSTNDTNPSSDDGAYAAAVIGNTIVIPILFSVLVRGVVYSALRWGQGISHEAALVTTGWPTVIALPMTTLAEGIGVSIVYSLRSDTVGAVVCGVVGCLVVVAFLGAWAYVLLCVIPRGRIQLVVNVSVHGPSRHPDGAGDTLRGKYRLWSSLGRRAGSMVQRVISPLQLWAPLTPVLSPRHSAVGTGGNISGGAKKRPDGAAAARTIIGTEAAEEEEELLLMDGHEGPHTAVAVAPLSPPPRPSPSPPLITEDLIEQYGDNALGDKRLYYAEIISFVCSLVVGAMEGMPPTHAYCRPRAVVALMATCLQCACSCLTLVPVELFLQALMTFCVVPMSIAVVFRVFADGDGGGEISSSSPASIATLDEVIAYLSMGANVLGLVLLFLTLALSLLGALVSRREWLADGMRRLKTKASAASLWKMAFIDYLGGGLKRAQRTRRRIMVVESEGGGGATTLGASAGSRSDEDLLILPPSESDTRLTVPMPPPSEPMDAPQSAPNRPPLPLLIGGVPHSMPASANATLQRPDHRRSVTAVEVHSLQSLQIDDSDYLSGLLSGGGALRLSDNNGGGASPQPLAASPPLISSATHNRRGLPLSHYHQQTLDDAGALDGLATREARLALVQRMREGRR